MTALPHDLIDLMRGHALCFVTTLMPDGSPHITETWVDTDGDHIVVNTVSTHQKMRNIERDPRVAVAIADPDNPARYWAVRGRVTVATTDGADAQIDALSQRYLGRPYPGFGSSGHRVSITISADKVHSPQH